MLDIDVDREAAGNQPGGEEEDEGALDDEPEDEEDELADDDDDVVEAEPLQDRHEQLTRDGDEDDQ